MDACAHKCVCVHVSLCVEALASLFSSCRERRVIRAGSLMEEEEAVYSCLTSFLCEAVAKEKRKFFQF